MVQRQRCVSPIFDIRIVMLFRCAGRIRWDVKYTGVLSLCSASCNVARKLR